MICSGTADDRGQPFEEVDHRDDQDQDPAETDPACPGLASCHFRLLSRRMCCAVSAVSTAFLHPDRTASRRDRDSRPGRELRIEARWPRG
jgi:hypothetical protein